MKYGVIFNEKFQNKIFTYARIFAMITNTIQQTAIKLLLYFKTKRNRYLANILNLLIQPFVTTLLLLHSQLLLNLLI